MLSTKDELGPKIVLETFPDEAHKTNASSQPGRADSMQSLATGCLSFQPCAVLMEDNLHDSTEVYPPRKTVFFP